MNFLREGVRVARKLAELALVYEQLRLGALSYSQARAITRVATAEKKELWSAYAKRMPALQLDKVLPRDEAAIVWAALNAASAKAGAAPTPENR